MKTFKKLISILLIVTMVIGLTTAVYAGEDSNTDEEFPAQEWVGTDEHEDEIDLSGQEMSELSGDGSEYQVTDIVISDDNSTATVSYIAAEDAIIEISIKDEDTAEEVYRKEIEAPAGTVELTADLDAADLPEFFWAEVTLAQDGEDVSDVFTYIDRSSEYIEFINATKDDPEYADNVILDYGTSEEGKDNFAVVRADVKVVYVDSAEDISTMGEDSADLFGLLDDADGYIVNNVVNEEVVETITSGDKVLLLPKDDVNGAKILTVDQIEETASLFGEEEGSSVAVTAAEGEKELEDYFEFVRVSVEIEADTEDIDTSDADEDVEFLDEEVVDPNAEEEADLFASVKATQSLTAKISSGNVTVKDTISVSAKISLDIECKKVLKVPVKINKVTASSNLEAKNVFNIHSSKSAKYSPDPKKLGSIPLGTVAGISFSLPVYFTFSAEFAAVFDFTSTQVAGSTVTCTYKGGSFSVNQTTYASSTKSIETEAKVVIKIGLKALVKASFLKIISVEFGANAGVQITGSLQSINQTATYRHTDVIACLNVDLAMFVIPEFYLKLADAKLASKKWSQKTFSPFLVLYVHKKASSGWAVGTGFCPYREYKVTYTVKDGKTGKAISGVAIKEGSKTLGTTNNKGVANIWLSRRSHTLKLSKSGYNTGTSVISVTASTSKDFKLYKTGSANDAIVSMTDLYNITDAEWATFTNEETADQAGNIGNTIIQIKTKDDLVKLGEFTARTDRSTANIKFQFNNETSSIDMSGAWTPIGTESSPFKGLVDGNKFTVTGLTGSLFGYVENAEIHDLTIENAEVAQSTEAAGVLARIVSNSKIYDIGIIGGSVSGTTAGGIVGEAYSTDIINSFSTAAVNGTFTAGGIAGTFEYTNVAGRMENVYAAGTVSSNGGGIVGSVPYTSGQTEEEGVVYDVGIKHAYYLEDIADEAYASKAADAEVNAFAVTEAQAQGIAEGEIIAEDDELANTDSLLGALNNWYAKNGSISISTESAEDPEAQDGIVETEIPESSPNDYYNHWYEDSLNGEGNYFNAGCPTFGEKAPVYKLTVEYVYEDLTEAFPTVVMFYTEGQAYDVDTRSIEGYHTYEDSQEYKGNMPANDLWYRVIYVADSPYTGTMTELTNSGASAAQGSSYSIASEDELIKFSEYVNAGKNTSGVTFVQTNTIILSDGTTFQSAGTNSNKFAGTFEGQNYGIENLNTGLFGYTDAAMINQVSAKVIITATSAPTVGGIVGTALDTKITGCRVEASIAGSAGSVGGIVGVAQNTLIDNCIVEGTGIQGNVNAGGIAGNIGGGKIINSYAEVPVSGAAGSSDVGGIAGKSSGYGQNFDHAVITNSYATGNVSGGSKTGGIVGEAEYTDIANVYYGGTVTGGDALVKTVGSDVTLESIWYKSGNTSAVSGAESFELTEAGVAKVLDGLTSWLEGNGDDTYLTWSLPTADEEGVAVIASPVFGAPYSNWIMAMDLSDGTFTCKVDMADYPDSTVYIAFYTASGQMKSMVKASAGSNTFSVANDAVMVKAFVMDANMIPMTEAVASN